MSQVIDLLLYPFRVFVTSADRLYWLYWLTAYLGGLAVVVLVRREVNSIRQGLAYLFPASIYLNRSVLNDCLVAYVNLIWMAGLFGSWVALISITCSTAVESWLNLHAVSLKGSATAWSEHAWLWTILLFLVSDFCMYVSHYLQHRIGWLWEFHKVHHSAEVMMPITVYRFHPLDNLFNLAVAAVGGGIAWGVIRFTVGDAFIVNAGGSGILMILFYLSFFNLRHSHVWFSYGPFLSRIFISPAQHQIHHSRAVRHLDKNFGFVFAFWDWMVGTLYLPKRKEPLVFGLNADESCEYRSLWGLLMLPFLKVYHRMADRLQRFRISPASVVAFLIALLIPLFYAYTPLRKDSNVDSVFLEEMTWPEVRQALDKGVTSIIIPTGGTEQNGPHLILGKHNAIVRYTAEEIARKLGGTLVAPVVAYVPEGNIDPPEGHMRYAGTLSVRETIFAGTLEDAARSLKQHGFKLILFLGDSGGNQKVQREVAASLSQEWAAAGVRVAALDGYYGDNHQVEYLNDLGFSMDQIGTHAGMRDTSEMLWVKPEGVRMGIMKDVPSAELDPHGYNGAVSRATSELGKELLRLKVKAAVESTLLSPRKE